MIPVTCWRYLILFLLFLAMPLAGAVQHGSMAGRVIDKDTQRPVSDVNILLDGVSKGITNEKGQFTIKEIQAGDYKVTFARVGYETRTKINVMINPLEYTIINIELITKAVEIEGASVTEEKFFPEIPAAPVSSTTFDIEEIKTQPAGSYDVQRAVQVIPSVVTSSDGYNEIIVRGGNFGENLFVIDNIELDNPNHFAFPSSGGGPVSMITPELVKDISFYGGAFPARYGDKTSSVMDISSRDGSNLGFRGKLDLSMAGYGGSIEGPLFSKQGSYLMLYHRSFMDLLHEAFSLEAVPNYESFIGKEVYHLSPTSKLTFSQIYAHDWIDITNEDESGYTQGAQSSDIYNVSGQYTLGATYKHIFDTSYAYLTYYRNTRWWENDIYDASQKTPESMVSYFHSDEARNTIKYTHHIPETLLGKLETGISCKIDEIDSELYMRPDTVFVYENNQPVDILTIRKFPENDSLQAGFDSYKYSGYLLLENTLGNLTLNTGIRYDRFDYLNKGVVSPTLGMKYPFAGVMWKMGLGRYYQSPDYLTLARNPLNRELKPKFSDQIVFGVDMLLSKDLMARIETYYKDYSNVAMPIDWTTPDPYDFTTQYTDAGEGYSKGIECFLQKKANHNWWGSLSYSYSLAQAKDYRYPDDDNYYNWDFDYRHSFTSVLGYKFNFRDYEWYQNNRSWLFYLGWLYLIPSDQSEISFKYSAMGGKPYTLKSFDESTQRWIVEGETELNGERFDPYQRFDIHIHHHWYEDKFNIITYLEFDNVFDTQNVWNINYLVDENGIPDTEYIYQWGLTLVGGLKIEF